MVGMVLMEWYSFSYSSSCWKKKNIHENNNPQKADRKQKVIAACRLVEQKVFRKNIIPKLLGNISVYLNI